MSNPMKYIKDLEAVGFERDQAEAQVQMVLDAIEGDLVTKSDFSVFQERSDNRLVQLEQRLNAKFDQLEQSVDAKISQLEQKVDARISHLEQSVDSKINKLEQRFDTKINQLEQKFDTKFEQMDRRFIETEFRLLTRLGVLMVSTTSIAVAMLTWLIKT